ncbi:MAG: PAS domain-containing sensor histidine kinase [bacterium]
MLRKTKKLWRTSEELHRAILDNLVDGILIADTKTRKFLTANKRICKMLGYTLHELENMGIMDIHPKKDLPFAVKQFNRLMRQEVPYVSNIPVLRKNGSIFYANIYSTPIYLFGKKYLMGVFRDVTEHREARHEKDRLFRAIEVTREGVSIHNADGKITYTNKAMDELYGYERGELIGKFASVLNAGDDPGKTMKHIISSLAKRGFWEGEVLNRRKDGSEFTSYAVVTVVRDEKGNIEHLVSTQHDISERKKIEKMKAELIRNVSHTLSTPVAAAEMALDMLLRAMAKGNSEAIAKARHILINSLETIRKDIDNIRKIYLIEERTVIKKKTLDLEKISKKLMEYVIYSASQKGIRLTVDIPANARQVFGNEYEIKTLLANIMDNAVKFTDAGEVAFVSRPKGKYVEIRVSDTGIGISERNREKVFEKFYKETASSQGVGLGLAICREVVKNNNGSIKVTSKGKGTGTTVIVQLPKGGKNG